MKTKRTILVTLLTTAMMLMVSIVPARAAEKLNASQIDSMTWSEIKTASEADEDFSEYQLVNQFVRLVSSFDKPNANFNFIKGTEGNVTDDFNVEFELCRNIEKKFNEATGNELFFSMHKYTDLVGITVSGNRNLIGSLREKVRIGEERTLKAGYRYYSSAWNWGSGKYADISRVEDDERRLSNGQTVKISAIAYLNVKGEVVHTEREDKVECGVEDNVMVLLTSNGVNMGWIDPSNL